MHKSIENYTKRTEDLKSSVIVLRERIASQAMTVDGNVVPVQT